MSDPFTISGALFLDASQGFQEIADFKAAGDEAVREWNIQRNTILRQVREAFTLISSLMSSARQAMSIIGAQLDPFFSALIGMVLSTASMLISSATTLALTGIGGVAAAVIFGLAISFQILTLGKLVEDRAALGLEFDKIKQDLSDITRPPSGLGGF